MWKEYSQKKDYQERKGVLKDSYVCHHCGYVLPKKEAKISGWASEHSLRRVHCPRCRKIVVHTHRKLTLPRRTRKPSFFFVSQ